MNTRIRPTRLAVSRSSCSNHCHFSLRADAIQGDCSQRRIVRTKGTAVQYLADHAPLAAEKNKACCTCGHSLVLDWSRIGGNGRPIKSTSNIRLCGPRDSKLHHPRRHLLCVYETSHGGTRTSKDTAFISTISHILIIGNYVSLLHTMVACLTLLTMDFNASLQEA